MSNFDIPQGWIEVQLGDVIELKYGKALPAKSRDGEQYPVFGSNGIVGYHSEPLIEGPALVVGRKGSIGEVHLSKEDCSPIDTTYFVNEFNGQPPLFWLNKLRCLNLADLNRATALPGLNRNDAYQLKLLLPPVQEQKRIVKKIEALQARSCKARKALEAIPPLLEKFRQSVLTAAFRGDLTADWRAKNPTAEPASKLLERIRIERRKRWEEAELAKMQAKGKEPKDDKWKKKYKEPEPVDTTDLPELPEGWCWAALEEIGLWFGGGTPSKKNKGYWSEGTIPWVSPKDMKSHTIQSTIDYITEAGLQNSTTNLLPEGSILIVTRSGILRRTLPIAIAGVDLAINQDLKGLHLESELISGYIFEALNRNADSIREQCSKAGTTVESIVFDSLTRFPIPIAPREEQIIIDNKLREAREKIDSISSQCVENSSYLKSLDQSILAKAFRGELVPQDPSEEPASQLLERIKQTKALAGQKTRKKTTRRKITAKTRKDDMAKRKERRPLTEVLQPHASGLSPEELFQQAGFDENLVDDFYAELKTEVLNGTIIEDRPDQERTLLRLNVT